MLVHYLFRPPNQGEAQLDVIQHEVLFYITTLAY